MTLAIVPSAIGRAVTDAPGTFAVLGNYMASTFATSRAGHSGWLITDPAQPPSDQHSFLASSRVMAGSS